ncbi:MAG: hypothetical protein NPIRA03_40670 [Nitrospirales bacterium]|nr:MAG: hypothetical protein NPIRA03_40670 [Nitrospirales bacterium]
MDDHRREALLKEYGEVSSSFRLLTDIRFKLLAFLPIATAAAVGFKGDSTGIVSFTLSLFGLVATIGLVTYNARNDQLYDELVGRAASIERSLGLPDGAFANRPRPWLTFRISGVSWGVDHRTGVGTIYAASIALWLFGLLAPVLEFARRTYVNLGIQHFLVSDPSAWIQVVALALAVLVTYLAARLIKSQKKQRADEMRGLAARAVKRALSVDLTEAANDAELVGLCAKLSDEKAETIGARARFYAAIDPESLGHYLPRASREQAASHLVALLTDLPPRWLFDCATNRRGSVAVQ